MLPREAYARLVAEVSKLVEALPKDPPKPVATSPDGFDISEDEVPW